MDKLTREAHDHSKIVETMAFFKKFLEAFTSNEAPDYIERLHQFSDEYIVKHFKFEEEKLFPFIDRKGNAADKRLVQELREEHVRILKTLAEFKDIISVYDTQPSKKQVQNIIISSETVISMILAHTHKEDKQLFPSIKKYII